MKQITAMVLTLGLVLLPGTAPGGAFEKHTSWHEEPVLETEKGISLGKAVLEMGMGFRYLRSDTFFNSSGNIQQLELVDRDGDGDVDNPEDGKYMFDVMVLDLFTRYGFTENWTLWFNVPIVWSTNDDPKRQKESSGEIGDCDTGLIYQFYREKDPTLSMGIGLRWKLPTGGEAPGVQDTNITGTGTTDVEIFHTGRWQVFRNVNIGWAAGYNIRFPGAVQYLGDQQSYISNAFVDLGDEIFLRGEVTGAIDMLALRIIAEFRYRLATEIAMPQYRAEKVSWINPRTGDSETDTFIVYNGADYKEWDVRERLESDSELVSSSGFIFTVTPQLIFRPLDWMDVTVFLRMHFIGKNSIFLTDKNNNNPSFDNFAPMQTLGTNMGGAAVLGELGGYATFRW